MYRVIVESQDGWTAHGVGDSPEEALQVALAAAREGASNVLQGLGVPEAASEPPSDALWELMKRITAEVGDTDAMMPTLDRFHVDSSSAKMYLSSPHRFNWLIQQIKTQK